MAWLFESISTAETQNCKENQDAALPNKPVSILSSTGSKLDNPDKTCFKIPFEYVESSLNFQGNYHNYVYKTLKSILHLKQYDYNEQLESKRVYLPELETGSVNKKTLILDMDETLIHADFDYNYENPDRIATFHHEELDVSVPIYMRPGLFKFLETVSENFEILVFTASMKEYADSVLNMLDPENKFFKQRFYRHNCICVKNRVYIKDLRIFANRKPENIIMVDNSMYSFTNQISNGVLINSFYNDKEDKELFNLLNYLLNYLQNISDVRSVNDKVFHFNSIIDDLIKSVPDC